VLLGAPVVRLLGLRLGDTLTLLGRLDPQVALGSIERRLIVRGTVRWLYDYRDQLSIGALLSVMQVLSGQRVSDRASAMVVKLHSDAEVEAVTARLRDRLPMLEVASVTDLLRQFRRRLAYFRQLSLVLGLISLGVTLLLVSTLMTITVNERLGEIATLRAIGVSRARIVQQVLTEGALLTLIGSTLGVVLGSLTSRYLDRILTSFPGLPAAISFFVPEPGSLAVAALVLLASGVLAGAYPALVAARAPIAETLRTEAT
jgi:putative ABC transport system permease protein